MNFVKMVLLCSLFTQHLSHMYNDQTNVVYTKSCCTITRRHVDPMVELICKLSCNFELTIIRWDLLIELFTAHLFLMWHSGCTIFTVYFYFLQSRLWSHPFFIYSLFYARALSSLNLASSFSKIIANVLFSEISGATCFMSDEIFNDDFNANFLD